MGGELLRRRLGEPGAREDGVGCRPALAALRQLRENEGSLGSQQLTHDRAAHRVVALLALTKQNLPGLPADRHHVDLNLAARVAADRLG